MASQTVQGWHPNPQLMHQHAAPQGWTGSWPPGGNVAFPPGYPGPPPLPGGGAAHPSWNAGYWQFNPMVNMQNQQQPWAPGAGWFPPNFNPYKRIPKPPSPSYWNTKLSDNGLGLEGMVKRKEPSDYNGEESHTPWIWNPPSLLESEDRATPTRDFNVRRTGSTENGVSNASTPTRDFNVRRTGSTENGVSNASTPAREYGQSSRGSLDSASAQAFNQTPDKRTVLRAGYLYNHPEHFVTPVRHGSDPTDIRSNGGGASAGPSPSHTRAVGQTDSWHNRTRSQPTPNEAPPYPPPTPTPHNRSSSTQHASVLTQEPESFTSKADLQPTFSSNIIRTPTHYQQVRRSTDEPPTRYSRSPSRGPEPVVRQASLPNASTSSSGTRDVYTNLTEDLSGSLPSRSRSSVLARSRTEPVVAGLTTIHESASALSSAEIFSAPLRDSAGSSSADSSPDPSPRRRERERLERERERERDRDRERARERERERDRQTSPYTSSGEPSPLYRDHRRTSPYAGLHAHPPHLSRSHSHSHSPSPHARAPGLGRRDTAPCIGSGSLSSSSTSGSGTTSTNSSGMSAHNPLPPPPMERASLDASRPPVQEPSPAHYSRKVRVGFWNRRGDHLTPNLFVVYAPHDRAYPEDLRDYPNEREGYRDQFGTMVPWRGERPELPASLPYHGRPPQQPYESFVVYAYLP